MAGTEACCARTGKLRSRERSIVRRFNQKPSRTRSPLSGVSGWLARARDGRFQWPRAPSHMEVGWAEVFLFYQKVLKISELIICILPSGRQFHTNGQMLGCHPKSCGGCNIREACRRNGHA